MLQLNDPKQFLAKFSESASRRTLQGRRWEFLAARPSGAVDKAYRSFLLIFDSPSKGAVVERSLSVLLPVRDAQSTLKSSVVEMLEVLPELTDSFELVVIDDGSTDATNEVATELSAVYPQVSVVSHSQSRGAAAAIHSGLDNSSGEFIFLRDADCRWPIEAINEPRDTTAECSLDPIDAGSHKCRWSLRGKLVGFQVIRRCDVHELSNLAESPGLSQTVRSKKKHVWLGPDKSHLSSEISRHLDVAKTGRKQS